MDTIDINLKKKKRRKLFTNIAIATGLSMSLVGVGVAYICNQDYQVTRAYDFIEDNDYVYFTFTIDEINTFSFPNFMDFAISLGSAPESAFYIYYDDSGNTDFYDFYYNESYGSVDDNYVSYSAGNNRLMYISSNDNTNCVPYFINGSSPRYDVEEFMTSMEYDYPLLYVRFSYEKGADSTQDFIDSMNRDIALNVPYTNNTFLQDIISLLVGGISATATGIGVGINTLVTDIAIQSGAMSSFVSIVLIFGAFALAFALSRWVVNLITSLGQRNR